MSYRLSPDEAPGEGVRRVVLEEIEGGIGEATDTSSDPDIAIHQVRKRCKRIRGLLQLFYGSLPSRPEEISRFRSAALTLAALRDAASGLQVFESLLTEQGGGEAPDTQPTVAALRRRREALAPTDDEARGRLLDVAGTFRAAADAARRWRVEREGWAAIASGLERGYRKGLLALARVEDERSNERLHRWRRWAKYHWYHIRLLEGMDPAWLGERRAEAHRLERDLGEDHDLALLIELLPELDLPGAAHDRALDLIEARRRDLQERALERGRELYKDDPRELAHRFERRWRRWYGADA